MALVQQVSNEDGVYLVECPSCRMLHRIPTKNSKRPNWTFNGDFEKPSFSPSLVVKWGDTICHSFIRDGQWQFLADSTHKMAGYTVPMIEIE